jgi:hypothetical protein
LTEVGVDVVVEVEDFSPFVTVDVVVVAVAVFSSSFGEHN